MQGLIPKSNVRRHWLFHWEFARANARLPGEIEGVNIAAITEKYIPNTVNLLELSDPANSAKVSRGKDVGIRDGIHQATIALTKKGYVIA